MRPEGTGRKRMSEVREVVGLTVESIGDDGKTISFRDGSEIRVAGKATVSYVNAFAVREERRVAEEKAREEAEKK